MLVGEKEWLHGMDFFSYLLLSANGCVSGDTLFKDCCPVHGPKQTEFPWKASMDHTKGLSCSLTFTINP